MFSSLLSSIFPTRKEPCKPKRPPYIEQSIPIIVQQQGTTQLLRANFGRIEIIDLIVQCQNNNTFQIFAGAESICPLLTFTPNQPASFSGIFLNWPDVLTIVCGNNSTVAVNIRYRIYR